jgi:Protein of unknown function (DUF1501)
MNVAADDYGYYLIDRRVHIHDLHATILHLPALIAKNSPTATTAATNA